MPRKFGPVVMQLADLRHSRERIASHWDTAIESFLNDRRNTNVAPATLAWYNRVFSSSFLPFLRGAGIEGPNAFTSEDVTAYVAWMRDERGNTPTTVNINLRAVRAFFGYLAEGEYIEKRPRVKEVRVTQKRIPTFSDADVLKLLDPPDLKAVSFAEYRDYVMVTFLVGTGVRLATLLALKVKDVDFVDKEIRLRHMKARREHVIPLPRSLDRILTPYLKVLKENGQGEREDYLFPNQYGGQMKSKSVEDRIRAYCQRRGVSPDVPWRPHTFRHQFAKMAVMSGVDVVILSKVLGHSNITTTQRYINLLVDDLRNKFISPLDVIAISRASKGRKAMKMPDRN